VKPAARLARSLAPRRGSKLAASRLHCPCEWLLGSLGDPSRYFLVERQHWSCRSCRCVIRSAIPPWRRKPQPAKGRLGSVVEIVLPQKAASGVEHGSFPTWPAFHAMQYRRGQRSAARAQLLRKSDTGREQARKPASDWEGQHRAATQTRTHRHVRSYYRIRSRFRPKSVRSGNARLGTGTGGERIPPKKTIQLRSAKEPAMAGCVSQTRLPLVVHLPVRSRNGRRISDPQDSSCHTSDNRRILALFAAPARPALNFVAGVPAWRRCARSRAAGFPGYSRAPKHSPPVHGAS